jgi:hypothetical protein
MRLSILHIQRGAHGDDGPGPEAVDTFVRSLVEQEVQPVGVVDLLCGTICADDTPRVLITTTETRLGPLSTLLNTLSSHGFSLLVAVDHAALENGERDALETADLPALLGSGGVIAARGKPGAPLVGLSPGTTRQQLEESRRQLSDAAGYPIQWLFPAPNSLGRAADRLVLDEANRAGFHHCLVPKPGRTNEIEGGSDPLELGYHVWGPSDTPANLAKWAAGNLLGRGATGLTSLLDAPSRIFRRFGHQSQRPTD